MKKVLRFLLNSVILFWGYFISSTLFLMIIQTFMRIFISADGFGEHLWKTIVLYLFMAATCSIHLLATSPIHKVKYFQSVGDNQWNFSYSCRYTIKNVDFWYNVIGFSIWPVLIPKLFGVIHHLYFGAIILEKIPAFLVSLLVVDIPFIPISFLIWIITLRYWSKKRLHISEKK